MAVQLAETRQLHEAAEKKSTELLQAKETLDKASGTQAAMLSQLQAAVESEAQLKAVCAPAGMFACTARFVIVLELLLFTRRRRRSS